MWKSSNIHTATASRWLRQCFVVSKQVGPDFFGKEMRGPTRRPQPSQFHMKALHNLSVQIGRYATFHAFVGTNALIASIFHKPYAMASCWKIEEAIGPLMVHVAASSAEVRVRESELRSDSRSTSSFNIRSCSEVYSVEVCYPNVKTLSIALEPLLSLRSLGPHVFVLS